MSNLVQNEGLALNLGQALKPHERVRPFNFRAVDGDDAAGTVLQLAESNAYFPLFRGGSSEVKARVRVG